MKRFKHLATCQLSCNVTTASKCAIFDELQEKIRSIASRPAQKSDWKKSFRAEQSRACHKLHVPVSDKSFPSPPHPPSPPPSPPPPPQHPKNNHTVIRQSRALRACHKLHVPVSDKSFPPPPSFPPSPPPHRKNNHTVIRRQCCETFQSSLPSILQRASYLATSQTSSKCAICDKLQEKIRSIASRPAQKVTGAACACVRQKFPTPSPSPSFPPPSPPPLPPNIITRSFVDNVVKRFNHLATCQASCNVPTILQRHNIF